MSVNVTVNGSSYTIPLTSESGWGDNLTAWIQAISSTSLQKTGGVFTLTADVDFGSTFGVKAGYLKSESANIALSGLVRLANTDTLAWRNVGNTADLSLKPGSVDGVLSYSGVDLVGISLTQTLTNKTISGSSNTLSNIAYSSLNLTGTIVNSDISASAAIAYSKLALSGSILNSDISSSAAVAYSKLALSGSIVNADLSASAGVAYSKLALTGNIVNADLSASAAIALTKIAQTGATTSQAIVWNGSQWAPGAAGGSGQGSKNYISNYNFEGNNTSGWSLFNTTLTTLIPTGSVTAGAASITTFATTSTNPLSGTYSLQAASSAAWSAGQGFISDAFTIDREDRSQVLAFKGRFEIASGTVSCPGTSSNNFAVYIRDTANSAWIQPAGVYSMVQNSGVGTISGTFQVPSNATSLQLAIVCINATSGAVTLNFDDFSVGPQTTSMGPAMSDDSAWTPTGSWTANTTYTGKQRRIGGRSEYEVQVLLSGAPTAATLTVNLPTGQTIDTSRMTNSDADYAPLGEATLRQPGVGVWKGVVHYHSSTSVSVKYLMSDSGTNPVNVTGTSVVDATHPVTWASTGYAILRFDVPIVGWSSNSVQSSDTDTRVVAVSSNTKPTGGLTSAMTTLVFGSVLGDSHGSYNTSTGVYTFPVSGWYSIAANSCIVASFVVGDSVNMQALKNGSTVLFYSIPAFAGGTISIMQNFLPTCEAYFNAGDTIAIQGLCTRASGAYSNQAGSNYFSIKRLSGPAVVQATETVAARYTSGAGQSIANGTTPVIVFGTQDADSHGIVNASTGVITLNIAGTWRFTAHVVFTASQSFTSGNTSELLIYKKGILAAQLSNFQATFTGNQTINHTGSVTFLKCNAGDTFDFRTYHGETTARVLSSSVNNVWMCVERIGN